jgi:hypothetical protein
MLDYLSILPKLKDKVKAASQDEEISIKSNKSLIDNLYYVFKTMDDP